MLGPSYPSLSFACHGVCSLYKICDEVFLASLSLVGLAELEIAEPTANRLAKHKIDKQPEKRLRSNTFLFLLSFGQ